MVRVIKKMRHLMSDFGYSSANNVSSFGLESLLWNIPDYVFDEILKERAKYEKNRSRRSKEFQDLDYIYCSSYGRPRTANYLGLQLKSKPSIASTPVKKNPANSRAEDNSI